MLIVYEGLQRLQYFVTAVEHDGEGSLSAAVIE
jgi:hypothetical protein